MSMKGMVEVNNGQRQVQSLFDTLTDDGSYVLEHVETLDDLWRLAYIDPEDEEALKKIYGIYHRIRNRLAIDAMDETAIRCLAQIDFPAINRLAIDEAKTHPYDRTGQPKWTASECSMFLEMYVLSALLERFIIVDDSLYFKELWGYWREVGVAATAKTVAMMAALMVEPLPIVPSSRVVTGLTSSFDTLVRKSILKGDTTIQFNDCVLTSNCELTQKAPERFPRFIFDFNIYDTIVNGKPVPEVDDLLSHLANGDPEVTQCLIDRLSMIFVTSASNKLKLGPKAIMLYGPTGENGKSTLAKLLIRAMRNENCGSFSFEQFTGYAVAEVADNLLLVDMDASSVHVSPDISTALKRAITADEMTVRRIYRSPETVTPFTQFVVCTNAMPKAEDKTRGWDRRLEWYEVKEKLVKDDKWFEAVESQEAADYLLAKLIRNAVRLVAEGTQIETPTVIVENNKAYSELNQNIESWLEHEVAKRDGVGNAIDFLNRKPSAFVYESYEVWCKENGETPLGLTKFNQTVSAKTGLIRKNTVLGATTDPEAFAWWQEHTSSEERFTTTKAYVKCWVHE